MRKDRIPMTNPDTLLYFTVRALCRAINIPLVYTPWSLCWIATASGKWGIWLRDSRPDRDPRGRKLKRLL